jgi:hypothetical protein
VELVGDRLTDGGIVPPRPTPQFLAPMVVRPPDGADLQSKSSQWTEHVAASHGMW